MVSILATIKTCKFACLLARVHSALNWGDVTARDCRKLLRELLRRHLRMLLLLLHHGLNRSLRLSWGVEDSLMGWDVGAPHFRVHWLHLYR